MKTPLHVMREFSLTIPGATIQSRSPDKWNRDPNFTHDMRIVLPGWEAIKLFHVCHGYLELDVDLWPATLYWDREGHKCRTPEELGATLKRVAEGDLKGLMMACRALMETPPEPPGLQATHEAALRKAIDTDLSAPSPRCNAYNLTSGGTRGSLTCGLPVNHNGDHKDILAHCSFSTEAPGKKKSHARK